MTQTKKLLKDLKLSRSQLLAEIKKLFRSMLLFSNEEINARMPKIEQLPDEGLIKLLKILNRGQDQQEHYFRILMHRDHMFASNIIAKL